MALSTEFERALSDLAEVRDRLARVQRFEGYSAPAAVASGIVALIAGVLQARLIPLPAAVPALHLYLQVWLGCLGAGLALNYGAVALWMLRNPRPGAHSQFRTAALSIAPSVLLGGAVTAALVSHGLFTLLPGVWFAFYAIGLFASRGAIPNAALVLPTSKPQGMPGPPALSPFPTIVRDSWMILLRTGGCDPFPSSALPSSLLAGQDFFLGTFPGSKGNEGTTPRNKRTREQLHRPK